MNFCFHQAYRLALSPQACSVHSISPIKLFPKKEPCNNQNVALHKKKWQTRRVKSFTCSWAWTFPSLSVDLSNSTPGDQELKVKQKQKKSTLFYAVSAANLPHFLQKHNKVRLSFVLIETCSLLSQILQKGCEWKYKLMSSLGVLRVFKFGQFRDQP